eukprot:GILI01004374.1.p1 GENE.GILI01004374.1~~GILI01004374.1.p1  ORF type:complete len:263 (+),score=49.06 GILI01004374.1:36-824(+)
MPAKKKSTPVASTTDKAPVDEVQNADETLETKDKTSKQPQQQSKSLLEAVRAKNVEDVKLLIKKGANLEEADAAGNTPLLLACLEDSYMQDENHKLESIALHLIKAGANVNAANSTKLTALHGNKSTKVAKAIVAAGGNLEALHASGDTPLRYAAIKGNYEALHALASVGANMDAQDEEGLTALHIAADTALITSIEALCEKKRSNVRIKDSHGRTAFDIYFQKRVDDELDVDQEEFEVATYRLMGKRLRNSCDRGMVWVKK